LSAVVRPSGRNSVDRFALPALKSWLSRVYILASVAARTHDAAHTWWRTGLSRRHDGCDDDAKHSKEEAKGEEATRASVLLLSYRRSPGAKTQRDHDEEKRRERGEDDAGAVAMHDHDEGYPIQIGLTFWQKLADGKRSL
jgi:hypothetical protein